MLPPVKIILLFGFVTLANLSVVASDSAGRVEMVNGLAYGGIPYGSVSGMLAKYPGYVQPEARQSNILRNIERPIITTPNFQATRLVGITPRPVQTYNLPGVIDPSVIGAISQIDY